MEIKALLSSKIALVLLAVMLAFLANAKYKQWKSQAAIEREKQNVISQAQELEKKNQELSESLSYLNSPGFKDRVARQQLNLKKEGELVYNFSDSYIQSITAENSSHTPSSNAQKWWKYFTRHKSYGD